MFSPMRSICFNDDNETFTVVLPSQYIVFRCEPFGKVFIREFEDLSFGNISTYCGYRFVALTGSPSPIDFNSKCVKIFDHQSVGEVAFEHTFDNHILTMKLGNGILVVNMYCKIEIWDTINNEKLSEFKVGPNFHCPLALSPSSNEMICIGPDKDRIYFCHNVNTMDIVKKNLYKANGISLVHFSHDGKSFITSEFSGGKICVWDTSMRRNDIRLIKDNEDEKIQAVDFSPDNKYVISCSKDGHLSVYFLVGLMKSVKEGESVCSVNLPSVIMPRISWLNDDTIGVISLEGDYYKVTFKGNSLEVETIPFLKRDSSSI